MKFTVTVSSVFNCSLERAFKTPILCDVAKVHTGFMGIMPKVTHCIDDENWGQPGFSKKIMVASSLTYRQGEAFTDKVLERIENQYWKIELSGFKSFMFGFSKFVGEWKTTEMQPNKVKVNYTYTLYAELPWLYPLNWLFAQTLWRLYMWQVMYNIRQMAYHKEPYLYA